MFLTSTHLATLAVVILSMLCLGLWANTFKMAGKWRFELYYVDFAFGAFVTVVIAVLTLGTLGFDGFSFMDDILHASKKQIVMGFVAGMVFNFGNMLLMAAVSVAGMAIAFSVAFCVALFLGAVWSFAGHPGGGNATVLFSGAAFVLLAAICGAYAYRIYKLGQVDELVKTGKVKSTRRVMSMKGVVVSAISGLFLGSFGPLFEKAQAGDTGLGPYAAAFAFVAGVMACTALLSLFLMNLPVDGPPLEIYEYFKGTLRQHGLGLMGGVLWCAGTIGILVAAHADGPATVDPPVLFGAAQGSAFLAALCGLLVWREFRKSDGRIRALLFVMLALFIGGLTMIAIAPSWLRA